MRVPVSGLCGTCLTNPPFHLCHTARWKIKIAYNKGLFTWKYMYVYVYESNLCGTW